VYQVHWLKYKNGVFMDSLTKAGTIIYAIPFATFGILNLVNGTDMINIVPSYLPFPIFWVYLTGLALIAASISIIIQKYTRLACLLLALMLFIFVFLIHLPGLFSGSSFHGSIVNLLKDISLAGAALVVAAVSSRPEPL
jgi:uncharacterized membrane protein YphA (DoxX/SURF4 family)